MPKLRMMFSRCASTARNRRFHRLINWLINQEVWKFLSALIHNTHQFIFFSLWFSACQTAVHKKCHGKLLGSCPQSSFNSESTIVSFRRWFHCEDVYDAKIDSLMSDVWKKDVFNWNMWTMAVLHWTNVAVYCLNLCSLALDFLRFVYEIFGA